MKMKGVLHIHIKTFGYVDSQIVTNIYHDNDGIVLIVSLTEDTQMIIGQAVFAVLSGRLVKQYIVEEKIGMVISFSAGDALVGRIHRLQTALDYDKAAWRENIGRAWVWFVA